MTRKSCCTNRIVGTDKRTFYWVCHLRLQQNSDCIRLQCCSHVSPAANRCPHLPPPRSLLLRKRPGCQLLLLSETRGPLRCRTTLPLQGAIWKEHQGDLAFQLGDNRLAVQLPLDPPQPDHLAGGAALAVAVFCSKAPTAPRCCRHS